MASLAFALLADGRFPAGGHVHSAGVEAAVADGRITGIADLEAFLLGRLHTTGGTEAALAAATVVNLERTGDLVDVVLRLDAEAEARIPSPPLRAASRRLGRQLVRAGAPCWPSALLVDLTAALPGGAHQPVALGAVARSAGLGPLDAALLSLHHALTTPVQAGVRLLGIDPFAIAALTARLGDEAQEMAGALAEAAQGPLSDLPAAGGAVTDIAAAEHAARDGALFAT